MNQSTRSPDRDPKIWPVVECEPTDVFLGVYTFNCATQTEEPREPTRRDTGTTGQADHRNPPG